MSDMKTALEDGLKQIGLPLEEDTKNTLCRFGEDVIRQNEVMNLTAITEPEKVAILHLTDSVTVLKTADLSGKSVIDIGCGAGFPGVPAKIACPGMKLTLLDSLGKRMNWLSSELAALGVEAECITARAEEAVADRRERYDVATSRAVARLNILLELTAPYVRVGGYVLAMKGTAAPEELEEAESAIRKLGLQLERVAEYPVDGTCHKVIVLKKVGHTPARYPRRYAKIKQMPL